MPSPLGVKTFGTSSVEGKSTEITLVTLSRHGALLMITFTVYVPGKLYNTLAELLIMAVVELVPGEAVIEAVPLPKFQNDVIPVPVPEAEVVLLKKLTLNGAKPEVVDTSKAPEMVAGFTWTVELLTQPFLPLVVTNV